MLRIMALSACAVSVCVAQAVPVQAASKRSFAECQQLAVERGVRNPKMPQRYTELGPKARDPRGFMAQCMAGKPV